MKNLIILFTLCLLVACKEKSKTKETTIEERSASEFIADEIIAHQIHYEDSLEARRLDDRLSTLNDSIGKVLGNQKIPDAKKEQIVSSLRQEVKILTAKWDTVK